MRKLVLALLAVGLGLTACSKARNDETILTGIKAGLFSDAQTKSANIDVIVKNGTATLVGEVPDEDTRYEAFKIAKETPGVVDVQDQMTFQQAPRTTARKTAVNAAPTANPSSSTRPAREQRIDRSSPPVRPLAASANSPSNASKTRTEDYSPQQATNPQPTPANDAPPAAAAAASAPAPAPVVPAPPAVRQVSIPSGTPVHIQMIDSVDSGANHVGDIFR